MTDIEEEFFLYHVQFPGLGISINVDRVAVSIGGFDIYWYGIIIGIGVLLALIFAFKNLKYFV